MTSLARGKIVVVGAGLLGLATSAELARRGYRVTVLERAVPGAEASTAAAGILGPQLEHDDDGPTLDLGVAGARATIELVRTLAADANAGSNDVDDADSRIGLIENGALKVAFNDDDARALARRAAWQKQRGLRVDVVDAAEARRIVPALGDGVVRAAVFPDDHCLDPKLYGRALARLALARGVEVKTGVPLTRLVVERDRCVGAVLDDGTRVMGDAVVVCAGAWSTKVPGVADLAGLADDDVFPVRGQIVELAHNAGAARIDRVVYGAGVYAVPRRDGRVLLGSTTEHAGYDKRVTAAGIHAVLDKALRALPSLSSYTIGNTWAGLRPSTKDGLPLLGETHTPGLWLSTGHYRNGVLLAAISARILGALFDSERTDVDVAPFSPKRVRSEA